MSLSFTTTIMDEQPQTVNITHFGMLLTVSIRADRYMHGGGLAVQLVTEPDGEWYATVSMNLELPDLADDEFVFKT